MNDFRFRLVLSFTFSSTSSDHPTLRDRVWNVIKYSFILIIPFYQINAFLTILILLMDLCKMKKHVKKFRKYYNGRYLWFLPNHEELDYKDSVLSLELTSALFGPCLTICLNSVLLWYTPNEEMKWSQYVSIGFSSVVLTKAFAGALSFHVEQIIKQRSITLICILRCTYLSFFYTYFGFSHDSTKQIPFLLPSNM